ncbi:hypothetical protein TNCV_1033351 [Trichonephila clavipes]|nr:hypothetical protein TNCV_1033351 [Trichonephila clavipes]
MVMNLVTSLVESWAQVLMPLKIRRVEGLMHVKPFEAQSPPVCVVRKFGGEKLPRVILVTWPWFQNSRSVANNLRVALQGVVSKHSFIWPAVKV